MKLVNYLEVLQFWKMKYLCFIHIASVSIIMKEGLSVLLTKESESICTNLPPPRIDVQTHASSSASIYEEPIGKRTFWALHRVRENIGARILRKPKKTQAHKSYYGSVRKQS